MKILACVEFGADGTTCTAQAWVEQPGLLPPLPADQGLLLSGYMAVPIMAAWGFKFVRRYLAPKS